MTESDTDTILLQRFVRDGAQDAFAEVVRRHIDMVYSVARRKVRAPELAEEVAQSVFVELTREARRSRIKDPLAPWLYVVASRTAIDFVRSEVRRRNRDQTAMEISAMNPTSSPWSQIDGLLDEALDTLSDQDRGAIVLHYFQRKTFREVGAAIGSSEDAAQKRVSRALEQLRTQLQRRGVTVAAATLGADLMANGVETAPDGLFAAISASAITGAGVVTAGTLTMITIQKTFVAVTVVAAICSSVYFGRLVRQRDSRINELEQSLQESRANEQQARRDRADMAQRMATPPSQSQASASVAEPDRMISAAGQLIGKVRSVQGWLAQHPERSIPELSLLTDEDWLQSLKGKTLETEADFRKAMSALRMAGKEKFAKQLHPALRAFADANDGTPLAELQQLTSYFAGPIDPAILGRYSVQSSNDGSAPSRFVFPAIREKPDALVDEEFDTRTLVSTDGGLLFFMVSKSGNIFEAALKNYTAANDGKKPATPEQLQPYLSSPIDPERMKDLFKSQF